MLDSSAVLSNPDKRNALELVLQSRTFARSEQLRAFLRYVCTMEMDGRGEQISEYRIAVEALGRPQDYTTAEDSAVRSRAYALRAKLEELYTHELPNAPIRIDLFKGSYRPHFVLRKPLETTESEVRAIMPAVTAAPQPIAQKRRWLTPWLPIISAAIAFLAGVRTHVLVTPKTDSLVVEAWGPLFNVDASVLVSVASYSHLQVRGREVRPPESELAVDAPAPVYEWYKKYYPLHPGNKLYLEFVDTSTRFGDAIGASEVLRTIVAAGGKAQIFPQKSVSEAMFRDRNVVLIGVPENSPAIDRLLSTGAFRVQYDETLQKETIVGPTRGGSPSRTYVTDRDARGMMQSYGLVTVLPGEGAMGSQHRIIIFSGSHSSCTVGSSEFLSSPSHLRELRKRLSQQGYSGFPPAYQMVIHCTADGVLPLSQQYVTHFVLK